MLIEEPIAVGHIAGENVIYVEAVHDAGTVVHQVHHLTSKLDPLIQAHIEQPRLLVLHERGESLAKHSETDPAMAIHGSYYNTFCPVC